MKSRPSKKPSSTRAGAYTSVFGPPSKLRSRLAAVNAYTGELLPWAADIVGNQAHIPQPTRQDFRTLVAQTRKLVTQLNTTMGTVNYQLQAMPDMVARTRQILDETDATLRAVQNTWPISSSIAKKPDTTLTPVQPPQ